jgi:putative transposase
MNALLMAAWRRNPADAVMVHSDQGSQFTSKDWRDNAVAESFLQLLNASASNARPLQPGTTPGRTSSATPKCSTIRSAVGDLMTGFRKQSLSEGILNGSRVSSRLVAIQFPYSFVFFSEAGSVPIHSPTLAISTRQMKPKITGPG